MSQINEIDNFYNQANNHRIAHYPITGRSRVMVFAKIALPILAAVLCLILLFFPVIKKDINEFAIDLIIPDGDIEKMNAENTSLYVTDAKGRINNFNAISIRETSGGSKIYTITKPDATLPLDKDEWINLRSSDATYDQQNETIKMPHKVDVFYSRGLNIETRDFIYDFKQASGYSHNPVVGYGFLGHLNSEGIAVSANDDTITFLGKTTIIIDENNLKKETE